MPGAAHLNGTRRRPPPPGLLIAFEGGEGSGKTTQARLISIWLRELGYDVVTTHEPGATKVGMRLRALLLDTAHTGMSPRAEALMYAADRAEHVASVIAPALDRGAIVITDRYVDSSLAYQGAGRDLPVEDIARFNWWATGGRIPDLTILLDMDPIAGLRRRAAFGGPAGGRARRVPPAGPGRASWPWPGPSPPGTWCSTPTGRPTRSPGTSRTGSAACSPTRCRRSPRPSTGDFPAIREEVR